MKKFYLIYFLKQLEFNIILIPIYRSHSHPDLPMVLGHVKNSLTRKINDKNIYTPGIRKQTGDEIWNTLHINKILWEEQ